MAKRMVTEFGMSSLGPINYDGQREFGWLAREMSAGPRHSQEMASKIDAEVKKIMDAAYKKAKGILRKHENVLNKVARALLEHETVRGPEYEKLLA
jgi:cell division protease FtsH